MGPKVLSEPWHFWGPTMWPSLELSGEDVSPYTGNLVGTGGNYSLVKIVEDHFFMECVLEYEGGMIVDGPYIRYIKRYGKYSKSSTYQRNGMMDKYR